MSHFSDLSGDLRDSLERILRDLINDSEDELETTQSMPMQFSTIPASHPSSSLHLPNKKSKKKRQLTSKYPRYKNLRTDIRDSYGKMFVNSMNTYKFKSMLEFCNTYFTPDSVCFVQRQLPHKNVTSSYIGPNWLANIMYSNVAIFPDSTVYLKESTFHKGSTNGAVTFKFEFQMTKMFNLPSIFEILPNMVIDHSSTGVVIENSTISTDVVEDAMEKVIMNLPQRKVPVRCSLMVSIVMLTDPQTKMCTRLSVNILDVVNDFTVERSDSNDNGSSSSSSASAI